MRLRPALLTISFMLFCSASALIAMESAQTPADATPRSSEDAERSSSTDLAAEVVHGGFFVESEGDESAGVDNRVIFSPQSGAASQSMQHMRARLADPEQRVAVRAEQRAGIEDLYPDVAEVLSLDAATHKAGSAHHSSSGMMVIGRKAYSIEMTANASRK